MLDRHLRDELRTMAEEDQSVRTELAANGSLFEGYHPRMEAVHRRNGARLAEIIEAHGWPDRDLVGEDGAAEAWLILQHAIGMPDLLRRGLILLRDAVRRGKVHPAQVAMLEDRIRVFEGRPQVYGTQYDWDENGEISPLPIEDPDTVDSRRRQVGLPPLDENTRRMRDDMARAGAKPPVDHVDRQEEKERWARSVGWRV